MLIDQIALFILTLPIAGFTLASWGRALQAILKIDLPHAMDHLDLWVGLVFLVLLAEFTQLFLPLQWPISLFCIGFALMSSLTWQRMAFLNAARSVKSYCSEKPQIPLILTVTLIFICLGAMVPTGNYDSGLYHFGTIAWLNQYPIALGLGNLHSRFAFNQSYFSAIGLLNFYPVWSRAYALMNPLLLSMVFLTLLQLRSMRPHLNSTLFFGCMLICAFFAIDLSSPIPDCGVGLLQIILFAMLYQQLNMLWLEKRIDLRMQFAIVMLCGLLACFKLSGLAFALGALFIAILQLMQTHQQARQKITGQALILLCIFLIVHFIRGYLLSGAPFYPSTFGMMPWLDWSMSPALLKQELAWAYSWSRIPGADPQQILGNWRLMLPWEDGNWIVGWLKAMPLLGKLAFVTGGISASFILLLKKISHLRFDPPTLTSLYIPLACALVYWFFTAPDIRFLGSVHWLFALLNIHVLLNFWIQKRKLGKRMMPISVEKGIYMASIVVIALQIQKPDLGKGRPIVENTPIKSQALANGAMVNIPIHGDQCNLAPLPCTPYYDPQVSYILALDWWPVFTRSK